MVNRYNEIAEKMPWIKKKDNPRKPWDSSSTPTASALSQDDEGKPSNATNANTGSGITASKEDVINKIRNIQGKVNSLTEDNEKLAKEISETKEELTNRDTLIGEKDNNISELKDQIDGLEKEKTSWEEKINDLSKALKTATSEKAYLEQELAAADKALSEINNLLN